MALRRALRKDPGIETHGGGEGDIIKMMNECTNKMGTSCAGDKAVV